MEQQDILDYYLAARSVGLTLTEAIVELFRYFDASDIILTVINN